MRRGKVAEMLGCQTKWLYSAEYQNRELPEIIKVWYNTLPHTAFLLRDLVFATLPFRMAF